MGQQGVCDSAAVPPIRDPQRPSLHVPGAGQVPYCTSDAYMGCLVQIMDAKMTDSNSNGSGSKSPSPGDGEHGPWQFRGARVVRAVLKVL